MDIKSMNAEELKEKLDSDNEIILVDCREVSEWQAGHIKEAKFLPLSELEGRVSELDKFKNRPIVMQCRSGKRSMKACEFLKEQGFSDLTNLEGGILGWMDEGHEIIEGD